jgi:hypothetical protein
MREASTAQEAGPQTLTVANPADCARTARRDTVFKDDKASVGISEAKRNIVKNMATLFILYCKVFLPGTCGEISIDVTSFSAMNIVKKR